VSGNAAVGISIFGAGTASNVVQGNLIGTDKDGVNALGNALAGVALQLGTTNNTIGGTTAPARNIVSGNSLSGIEIKDGGSTGNVVEGNYIGTNSAGTAALGNSQYGVNLESGSINSVVNNTISGNAFDGINISGNGIPSSTVAWWRAEGNGNDSV